MSAAGEMLRHWRKTRRMSQQALAEVAEVSQRHLSHLETGKAQPSQQMVLVLTSALDVPLRERNAVLAAAGYPAAYRETDLDAPEMAAVRQALDLILGQAVPFGAVVVDTAWEVRRMNRPYELMMATLVGPDRVHDNLMRTCFAPDGLRMHLRDWERLASNLLRRTAREVAVLGDRRLAELLDELVAYPGVPEDWSHPSWSTGAPDLLVPFSIELMGQRLSLFSTITTLGTPLDITLQDLRIETFHPADDATEQLVRTWWATMS